MRETEKDSKHESSTGWWIAPTATIGLCVALFMYASSKDDDPAAPKTEEQQQELAFRVAEINCPLLIESKSTYSIRWTDRALEPKFSRLSPRTAEGLVVASGDRAEMQNEYGAWIPVTYHCVISPERDQALAVQFKAGRL